MLLILVLHWNHQIKGRRQIIFNILCDLRIHPSTRYILLYIYLSIVESMSKPPIRYLYYKDDKYFEHFHYVYNLMRDCRYRLEKIQGMQEGAGSMSKGVVIKIGIAGYIQEDNLNLLSRRTCTVL